MNLFKNKKLKNLDDKQVRGNEERKKKTKQLQYETNDFIQKMSKLLAGTVKQHHMVDD